MDVAQQEVPEVGEREPAVCQSPLECRDAARGPAVEQREAVVGLDEVATDDAFGAAVKEVD
jgi:hypothetical protein